MEHVDIIYSMVNVFMIEPLLNQLIENGIVKIRVYVFKCFVISSSLLILTVLLNSG